MITEEKTPSVFISHSSKDDDFVHWLVGELERHGIEVWVDQRHLKPGDSIYVAIGNGLEKADRFIIVLSENAVASHWVNQELRITLNREAREKRQMIIPVLLEQINKMPMFIEDRKFVDFTLKKSQNKSLKELLRAFGMDFGESEETGGDKIEAKYEARVGEKTKSNRVLKQATIAVLILTSISILVGYKIWNSINGAVEDKIENASKNINTAQHSGIADPTSTSSPPASGIDFEFVRVLKEQTGIVWSIDFSSDGKLFATGNSDGKVRIWDTGSWDLKYELDGHSKSVNKNINSIAFSPDSQILVSGGSDKTIRIWNLQDGSLLRTINAHKEKSNDPVGSGVISVNFSKDGKWLVSSGFDGSIFVWNTSDDWMPFEITKQQGVILSAIFSPDSNSILSNSGNGGIQFWSNKLAFQPGPFQTLDIQKQFSTIVFSPNGNYLAGGNRDKEIRIWTTYDWKEIKVLADHDNAVSSIFFFTDQQIISSGYDHKVKIWNVESGSSVKIKESNETITAVKVSPDRTTLAICGGKVEIWLKK